jgi:hypothetical protein
LTVCAKNLPSRRVELTRRLVATQRVVAAAQIVEVRTVECFYVCPLEQPCKSVAILFRIEDDCFERCVRQCRQGPIERSLQKTEIRQMCKAVPRQHTLLASLFLFDKTLSKQRTCVVDPAANLL